MIVVDRARGVLSSPAPAPRHVGPEGSSRRPWGRGLSIALLAALTLLTGVAAGAMPEWCHRIQRGDTLHSLARRYSTTVATLRRLNGLDGKTLLRAGQILTLPALGSLRRGTLALDAAPLTAPPGHLHRENAAADRQDLSRIRDRRMLQRFVRARLLVPLPEVTRTFRVVGVPDWLRATRPWTRRFIEQLAAGLHGLFGTRLKVTSLTRTPLVQRALTTWNDNAAPADGRVRSTHLTGASVDLSKQPLSDPEVLWLRHVLRRLTRQRLLSAIEELQQAHFHVFVFKRYLAYARTLRSPVLIGGC